MNDWMLFLLSKIKSLGKLDEVGDYVAGGHQQAGMCVHIPLLARLISTRNIAQSPEGRNLAKPLAASTRLPVTDRAGIVLT